MQKPLVLLLLFSCLCVFSQQGKVIKIKDGDTIVILDSLHIQHIIRVADIDCPERGQPFSNTARTFVSEQIFCKEVFVEKKSTDKYDRTIGYVLYDDKNLSLELLKMGLAWHYSYYSDDQQMALLELEARESKVGLWIDNNAINPYLWRKGDRN